MPVLSLLVFGLALAAVGAILWLARGIQRACRYYFLSSYVSFLLAFNLVGILNLIVEDLAGAVLKDLPERSLVPVYILFGLVALPLLALAFHYFIDFLAGLLSEDVKTGFRAGYFIGWIGLGIVFLLRAQAALTGNERPIFQTLSLVSGGLTFLIPFAALAYLALRSLRRDHARERKALLEFSAASAVSFFLIYLVFVVVRAGTSLRLIVPLVLFAANAGPLVLIRRFLSRVFPPVLPGVFDDPPAERIRAGFQISTREGEILALLLAGKSNKQIEAELYISPNTVRNHVYNIYKKLGVSSRLELLNFVRSRMGAGSDHIR